MRSAERVVSLIHTYPNGTLVCLRKEGTNNCFTHTYGERTTSPFLMLPSRTAPSSAKGIEAAEVLPYSDRFETTRSAGN